LPTPACINPHLFRHACFDSAQILGIIGRLPQIAQNLRQGHTGELAFITYFMNVLGAIARLFTTLQV